MRRSPLVLLAFAMSCFAVGESSPAVTDPQSAVRSDPVLPDAPPATQDVPDVPEQKAWKLARRNVLLELEYEPTFTAAPVADPFQPYGRTPEVTVYDDGTVIYAGDRDGVFVYVLDEHRVKWHLEHVLALGAEEMRSYEQTCRASGVRRRSCLSDAGFVHLRFRTALGELRELRNYSGWEMKHEVQLHAIYDRLALLRHPESSQPPALYIPERASLFLTPERGRIEAQALARIETWPLGRELFDRARTQDEVVVAIDATTIQQLVEVLGTNATSYARLRLDDDVVALALVPWFPGVDHPAVEPAA